MVEFWASWCVPCRRTKPVLDRLGQEFSGRVEFKAINADEHPELMWELKIISIPTLIVVNETKEISRIIGAQSPENYDAFFIPGSRG